MTSVVLEFEAQSEYALDVTATDSQGHAVVKVLTVIVTDTNDPPTVSLPFVFRGLLCALLFHCPWIYKLCKSQAHRISVYRLIRRSRLWVHYPVDCGSITL